MKTKIKTLFVSVFTVALLALTLPAHAGGVGSLDFGITNATLAGSSTITALGVSTVSCDQQDKVTLVFKGTAITTNTASVVLNLARVDGDGNVETTPGIASTVTLSASGTNAFVAIVDVPQTTLNASYGLNLVSVVPNSGVVSISSPVLKAWKKRLQAPN